MFIALLILAAFALALWWIPRGSRRDDVTERWEREVMTRGLTRKERT